MKLNVLTPALKIKTEREIVLVKSKGREGKVEGIKSFEGGRPKDVIVKSPLCAEELKIWENRGKGRIWLDFSVKATYKSCLS